LTTPDGRAGNDPPVAFSAYNVSMKWLVVALIGCAGSAPVQVGARTPGPTGVHVRVVDMRTHTPLPFAALRTDTDEDIAVYTDEVGEAFVALAPGTHAIDARRGEDRDVARVTVTDGTTVELSMWLDTTEAAGTPPSYPPGAQHTPVLNIPPRPKAR
jgi:hypothetical protein